MAGPQFQWHPKARLFDGRGKEQHPVECVLPVIAARPATLALATALASAESVFRVGGGTGEPRPALQPMLETLTSGSTGTPRRIRRTQETWIESFAVNARLFGVAPGMRVAVPGRLEQSLALYGAMEGLHLGAEVHLLDDLRPDRQRRAIADRSVDVLYASPALLRLMVEGGGPTWPALQVILVGGSKLDPGLRVALAEVAPKAVTHEFYGAAETSFITLADATTPEGSVGRPYPGVEIEIRGEPGAIWARSPYLAEGYAGGDPGSARWEDGWVTVGEIGRLEDGYLWLSGRAGRMVTVADQNVFPEEIECFMAGLRGVRHAAVVPVADGLRGAVLVAVVTGDRAAEGAILTALRARLGSLRAPRALIWRKDWPVLPSGKTDLVALSAGVRWPT